MKLESNIIGNSAAVTIAVIYIVCAASIILFPNFSMTIAQSWFHGLDLNKIATFNMSLSSLIFGFVTSTIGGWLIGYIFANAYNYFLKKK